MALPRGGDEELQQLKEKLYPLVSGHDLVSLDESFVPHGKETTGFEVEPRASSFYDVLPSNADEDDDDFESCEARLNRYAGVIYAARFFVTRVGFLRSVKRLLVLSSNHLTIVDPYSDEVKERYAFDNIKEITIASDSGGHNADRAFTIFIGKSLKETYTCRCRQQLLSAYYQLRERASSFRKDEIDAATADALSAVGASVSDNNWATSIGVSGGNGNSSSNLLSSGMYFDSLFQLCGKTFTMTKLSTTRSIAIHPVKVNVLLAVRAASLDRLDLQSRTTLSSILLIDIVKIQRVNTNSNELVLYFENNRVHRYWCDSREPFIQAIANNLRSWLSVSLLVEEVSDSCEFDALTSTRDIPQPVTFEMPVFKISKNQKDKLQLRLLGLTALAIIERDPVTRKTLASHSLNDMFNVVVYPSVSSFQDDASSEGLNGKLALELKHGLTRRYVCLSSRVCRRDKNVSLGLERVSTRHEHELRQSIRNIAGDIDDPKWLEIAGSASLLSPKEARSLFLSNVIEMCRMNKLHVPWSTEETKIACKEGTWGTEVHPEWEDILLRKLVNLNFVPNLVTTESMSIVYHHLVQFNRNIPLGGLRQRDRRAFASLMKVLENLKDYSVAQLNSPSSTDAPIPTTEFQVELLLAVQRLLCTRGVFEEIPSSQYKKSNEVIMELLHSPMEEVSFAAACVIKYMVVNYSDTRSLKSETANRRAIFTKHHSRMYVSRAFDLSKSNRVGRIPLYSTSLTKAEFAQEFLSVAALSNTERSMANALAYSQLGLDYLVLVMVLQTLEVCLSSGKKATPERVARDLLRAMRVEEFSRHHALFLFNRSLSFSITKCSSILVKVHILEQPTELVELIQDFARKHGALVWQLYLATYSLDKAQRRISCQLVALLTHENPRSSYVIRNIFPHSLLNDLKASLLEYDEYGRHLPTANPEYFAKNNGNSHKNGGRRDIVSGRSTLSNGINTRARLARNVKYTVLLPEFFERVGKTYATKELVWGPKAVEELAHKLQTEMSMLDLYRLKYLAYLYTDPLATDHTETEWDAFHANRLRHDLKHANFAPFLFDFLHHGSDSRLAFEILKGNLSSSNRFARFMPLSFLLHLDTSDDFESDVGQDDDNYDSDENTLDENGFVSRADSVPFPGDSLEPKQGDRDSSHDKLRNAALTKKKKKSAKHLPRWFIAWNCNEFRIDYECFENEVKVGPYYLANMLDDRGVLVEDIEGANKFMTLLYYRLLAEDRGSSNKNIRSGGRSSAESLDDVDQSDIRLLVLKVMIQIYERHFNELGSLVFLNHFLRVSMIVSRDGEDRRWPLIVRGNIMLFLDRVLSSAVNVSRFLREDENVTMVLDLLREVKPLVVKQGPYDSEKEYIVEPAADVQAELDASEEETGDVGEDDESIDDSGNFDEEEEDYEAETDIAKLTIDALEESGAESSIVSSHSVSQTYAHRDDESVHEEEPRRVTVVAEHCGAMSGSMIVQTCLSVLSRLIDCHTAEDEAQMHQDIYFPKYGRLTHFEGSGVSPISRIKRRLCKDRTLRFLVGLLDCPNRIVFKKCLGLIRLLVRHNEAVIPNLHASGIFYYLLRFSQDVEEMSVAARLISHIHLRQSGLEFTNFNDDKQKKLNKKGVISPDPLTRICLRSWLVRLLPVSMVAQLLRHGSRRFATALFSDANNPEVVWNANMHKQMVSYIEKFMEHHTDDNGVFYISENEGTEHKACVPRIQYPKEVHALQCYQYYLHNLLDEKNFPGWPINNEAAFLHSLVDSIRRWVHPELQLTTCGAMATEDQSTKLLSVSDAVELLDATALLIRRFPDSPNVTNLQDFSYYLEALERCITKLSDKRVGSTKTLYDVSNAIVSKITFVRAFESVIRVINLAVGISDENAYKCSSGLGLRVLCNSLQLLHYNQETFKTVDGCTPNVTTHWVLEALVHVFIQPNGRVSAAAQSIDLLPCLTCFLLEKGDRLATDLSLQIVYEMAGSCGEMAEILLLQLAEHGILWYLSLLVFQYQLNNDKSDNDLQRISIGAAKALNRILEANAREETIAVFVKRMQATIEQVFTRPLIDILRRSGPISMLDVLATEVREPHVMWTKRMRKELINLAHRAIDFHTKLDQNDVDLHKVFELPPKFIYAAQEKELCVAGIYVNFFNENPKNGILAQIAGTVNSYGNRAELFQSKPATKKQIQAAAAAAAILEKRSISGHVMHGLLAALSYDLSSVRAQPQALDSVLFQRLLPIATAIRNLLQYTPDMDGQLVQADGLVTLLFVLDSETQPQGFSFANSPLLLVRCMECVHILSFSGKCIEPLATSVPPFIRSAFQVVYKNLARTEASIEGQLARVTLQLLGNLCLIPACIDNLVKGMDPASLSNLLPHVWLGDSTEMQLLLCLHMIPLKRHTQAATEFAKAAVSSQLASALLNLLSTLVPKSKVGESTATKQYAARFLSVLSSNPGSGGAISSLLIASRVWETHGDTTQATSEDLRRLLVPPHAPALLKGPHANPNKVG
ncbi:hypothetical protein CCR75_003886 [Bremia lactucae]|uniref:DnaJ homologue subfamily C GRV2/DNAJC13 N-terminal domain-containing protein n=1 Tax=Bremia lactucae TaxID=4779 RepID=A0A976IIW9_BRELC|nr:hypothetical protein CCR75_003886 [Bremia lactucae]